MDKASDVFMVASCYRRFATSLPTKFMPTITSIAWVMRHGNMLAIINDILSSQLKTMALSSMKVCDLFNFGLENIANGMGLVGVGGKLSLEEVGASQRCHRKCGVVET